MPSVTQASGARARLVPTSDPRYGRLYDAVQEDLAVRGPLARERFDVLWQDTDALKALGRAKLAPLDPALGDALRAYHRKLGAGKAAMEALERVIRGEAVGAIAGQQPAPLGGPLYAFHKIAAAVGMARRFEARTGIPCVPMFWMHGEDSDFIEIRGATVADAELTLHDVQMEEATHDEGGLIGAIPMATLRAAEKEGAEHWRGLPAGSDVAALLERVASRATDLGEAYSSLVLECFADQGVVVVDPRLPAFRAQARGIIDRYAASAETLRALAREGGVAVEGLIGRVPLNDATLESFVFAIHDGVREKLDLDGVRSAEASTPLSPNVALRPAIQDGVLPTVAMACGAAETAYLAQLRDVFKTLEVKQACAVPRFGATWFPAAGAELMKAAGSDEVEVITATDVVLRTLAEKRLPANVVERLNALRSDAREGLDAFAEAAREVDASLPQMVGSARGKVDYQFQRLLDGLVGKSRHHLEQDHPEWLRLRYFLLPGDKLQERRLASLQPVAARGPGVVAEICDLAESHAEALEQGRFEHLVLDI